MIRKYISLHINNEAFRVVQQARRTLARADEQRRARNAAKIAGVTALYAVRRAFRADEKVNLRHWPESKREELRKFRAVVERDLKRIAGDTQ
jgi:hypothetical protein